MRRHDLPEAARATAVPATATPAMSAVDLSFVIGERSLVADATLSVAPGAVLGVLGPNGAGKSTLLRMLAGVTTPTTGSVTVAGPAGEQLELTTLRRRQRARLVAFLEQESDPGVAMTVLDVVLLGRIPHGTADDETIAAAALERVGCSALANRAWPTLSGGERQRVLIARAICQEPSVIVLDEPTNHLDISAQVQVLRLLRDLHMTTVAALHDLTLAAAVCDEVVVMAEGRIVAAGRPTEVLTAPLVEQVWGVPVTVLHHPTTGRPVIVPDGIVPDGITRMEPRP